MRRLILLFGILLGMLIGWIALRGLAQEEAAPKPPEGPFPIMSAQKNPILEAGITGFLTASAPTGIVTTTIQFSKPFVSPPIVVASLQDLADPVPVALSLSRITSTGFQVTGHAIYLKGPRTQFRIAWIAFGESVSKK